MSVLPALLSLAHLIGLALAVGSATAKLVLLLRCRADRGFLPTYLAVARPITRLIVVGMALLTLSGLGWLLFGRQLTPLLDVKLVLVAAIWVLGPVIDNAIEPKFRELAPGSGAPLSQAFLRIERRYVALESLATGLFYVIIVMWTLG